MPGPGSPTGKPELGVEVVAGQAQKDGFLISQRIAEGGAALDHTGRDEVTLPGISQMAYPDIRVASSQPPPKGFHH